MDDEMKYIEIVKNWILEDEFRLECLHVAASLIDTDWYISAGFVRNMIWDKLQGHKKRTSLNDVDLIYLDASNISSERDLQLQNNLIKAMSSCNWSVKNQARMSLKHGHEPYKNCVDAMSYWPEIQTAIGVTLTPEETLNVISPFSAKEVIKLSATRNPKCTSNVFQSRVIEKDWVKLWPDLKIEAVF